MFHIKQWTSENDAILSDLAQRFVDRRLFRATDLEMPEPERSAFVTEARTRMSRSGFDPEYYLVEDRARDIPYYSYYRPEGKARLFIERSTTDREICDIAEVSSVVRGMHGYEIHRLCFPLEAAAIIEDIR